MSLLKGLSLLLIVGSFAVSAKHSETSKETPRILTTENVNLLLQTLQSFQLQPTNNRPVVVLKPLVQSPNYWPSNSQSPCNPCPPPFAQYPQYPCNPCAPPFPQFPPPLNSSSNEPTIIVIQQPAANATTPIITLPVVGRITPAGVTRAGTSGTTDGAAVDGNDTDGTAGTDDNNLRYSSESLLYPYVVHARKFESFNRPKIVAEDHKEYLDYDGTVDGRSAKLSGGSVDMPTEKASDATTNDTNDFKLPLVLQLVTHPNPISNDSNKKEIHQEALILLRNFKKSKQLEEEKSAETF